jgi:hypothetical protein
VLVANQATRGLVDSTALDRGRGISLRGLGQRSSFLRGLGRGSSRGSAVAAGGTTDFAAGFTTAAATIVAAALPATTEQVFEQLDDRTTVELVALRLANFFASRSTSLLASRIAGGHWAARLDRAARATSLVAATGLAATFFLAAAITATSLLAARYLLTGSRAGLFAASRFGAAALGGFAATGLTAGALRFEEILQVPEQVADGSAAALLA